MRNSSRLRTRWHAGEAAPVVWLVGPWDVGEFSLVRNQLDPAAAWPACAQIDDALINIAQAAPPPEVILLAQPRPGCCEQAVLDRLQAAAPLVRIIVVAGSWCEGELRTGRPLTGALRLYWHELPAWWRRNLADRAAGRAPHWSGPRKQAVGGDADTLAASLAGATLAIDAIDFAVFETLHAALHPYGIDCAWTPRGRGDLAGATLGVWDGGQLDGDEVKSLRAFCGRFAAAPAPVLALLDYPRSEHLEITRQAGAASLLGKPYRMEALIGELACLPGAHRIDMNHDDTTARRRGDPACRP